jgi:hypothetical protein
VHSFLNDEVPSWKDFTIASAGEYLGFWVGPQVKDKLWKKALSKWELRGRAIAGAKVAPSLGVQLYNSRAVTPFGYVAQIYPLSHDAIKNEKSAVQRIFHVLNNTYPFEMYFRFKEIGMPQTSSLKVLSYAARYRAAVRTITVWQENLVRLNQARSENAPCGWFAGNAHSNSWWDTPPAVDYTNEASKAFNNKFGDLGKETRNIMKNDKSLGLQAAASRIIHEKMFVINFSAELTRRLLLWLPELSEVTDIAARISQTIGATKNAKPIFMSSVMLTWLNGWTTSFRTHSASKTCIFGCLQQDRLLHYVRCAPLWEEIYHRCGLSNEISLTRSLALDVPVSSPSPRCARGAPRPDVLALAVALDTYNNLKNSLPEIAGASWREQVRDSHRRITMMLAL